MHPAELNWQERDRRTILGGSEAAMALGLAPKSWGGLLELYLRKVDAAPEQPDNAAMSWGRRLEAVVIEAVAEIMGAEETIAATGGHLAPFVVHPEHDWLGCHPDGFMLLDGVWHAVEVKTTSLRMGDGEDGIPPYWWLQCQIEAACTGMPVVFGALRFPSRKLEPVIVQPSQELPAIIERLGELWERHIVGRELPPANGAADIKRLERIFPAPTEDDVVLAEGPTAEALAAYAAAKTAHDEAKAALAEAAADLCEAIGDNKGLFTPGVGRATWTVRRGSETVSLAKVKTEHPDLYGELRERGLLSERRGSRSLRFTAAQEKKG